MEKLKLENLIVKLLKENRLIKNPTSKKFLIDVITYPALGTIPTAFQESLAARSGINKFSFTLSQIGLAATFALGRYFISDTIEEIPYLYGIGLAGKLWSFYSILPNIVRISYMTFRRRPIGMLSIEIPYKIYGKITSKVSKIIEKQNLQ